MSVGSIGGSGSGFISQNQEDDLFQIHGVAIGSNDITRGHLSGERKLWTPEVLEESAETLQGQQLVVDHENRSSRDVVGEITEAKFQEGTGVIYKGVMDDSELAQKVGHGWLEVSPRIIHSEEMEERGEVKVPQKIHAFDNLSIVSKGAAESNEINLGDTDELSAEELQEAFAEDDDTVAEFQHRVEENAHPEDIDVTRWMYETAEAAQGAAESFPCEGIHEHLVEGETWYMPCSNFDEFLLGLAELSEEEKEGIEVSEASADVEIEDLQRVESLQRDRARRPVYDGTEESEWNAPDLEDYVSGYDAISSDVETVDDLNDEDRSLIAEKTLLGETDADNFRELSFFPVVNPSTDNLSRNALVAVRGGRGQQADIPDDAYASASDMAGELLNEEFDADVEVESEAPEVDDPVEEASEEGEKDGETEELAQKDKKRLAGQLSSFSELTRDQAQSLLNAMDPNEPTDTEALVIASSKALGVEKENLRAVFDRLQAHKDELSEPDETDDSPEVERLAESLGMTDQERSTIEKVLDN